MSITRLSGGLTPADGSDPRTFPAIWNATADDVEALQDDVVELETRGFRLVDTIYYTSNETFVKADYPWLRAVRVRMVGGGGGGGGVATTGANVIAAAGGGGGAGYAESFILASDLTASVTVTCGAGGAGGAAGNNSGSAGGNSSFGLGETFEVSAPGGTAGSGSGSGPVPRQSANSGLGTGASVGDLEIRGGGGNPRNLWQVEVSSVIIPSAGNSYLGFGHSGYATTTGSNGILGRQGGGGSGAANSENQATARSGGNGGSGIVIVELYA